MLLYTVARAHGAVCRRVFEEVDELLELVLLLLAAGDIGECDLFGLVAAELGARLAEASGAGGASAAVGARRRG